MSRVHDMSSIISNRYPVVVHHPIGASACVKIDLVTTNIGSWWLLPLLETEHAMMHKLPGRKAREKGLFQDLVCHFVMNGGWDEIPFPHSIYQAIMRWTR